MKIDATTIDELFAAAAGLGHDLAPVDEAIRAAVPELERWFFAGPSITMVGYGVIPEGFTYGDAVWPLIGLTAQKAHVSVYVGGAVQGEGIAQHYQGKMGKTNNGVGCIRFRRFDQVDSEAFARALRDASRWLAENPSR